MFNCFANNLTNPEQSTIKSVAISLCVLVINVSIVPDSENLKSIILSSINSMSLVCATSFK